MNMFQAACIVVNLVLCGVVATMNVWLAAALVVTFVAGVARIPPKPAG